MNWDEVKNTLVLGDCMDIMREIPDGLATKRINDYKAQLRLF